MLPVFPHGNCHSINPIYILYYGYNTLHWIEYIVIVGKECKILSKNEFIMAYGCS